MEQERFSKLDAALIILFFTLVGYAVAYAYELAYYHHYELPTIFIDLNVTNITRSIFITLLGAGGYILIINGLTDIAFKKNTKWNEAPSWFVISMCIILIIGGAVIGVTSAKNKEEYLTISDNGQYSVVLTSYKDHLVVAPVDPISETISPIFSLVELNSFRTAEIVVFPNGLKVKDKRGVESIQDNNK